MKTTITFLVIVFVIGFKQFLFSQEVNQDNWKFHPEIVLLRQQFIEIENSIKKSLYKKKKITKDYIQGRVSEIEFFIDSNNLTRKITFRGGSDDSAQSWNIYYSAEGLVQFIFITAGAVNGTNIEQRYYFKNRALIWEIFRQISGPGYGYEEGFTIPEELLEVKNAQQFLRKDG